MELTTFLRPFRFAGAGDGALELARRSSGLLEEGREPVLTAAWAALHERAPKRGDARSGEHDGSWEEVKAERVHAGVTKAEKVMLYQRNQKKTSEVRGGRAAVHSNKRER